MIHILRSQRPNVCRALIVMERLPDPETPDSPAPPRESDAGGLKRTAGETAEPARPDPTRYGDWEIGGRCIDF